MQSATNPQKDSILQTPSLNKKIATGLITGIASTIVFNPMDKALYQMTKDQTSIFNPNIWKNPYQGVSQALFGRIMGYGFFFTVNDVYNQNFGFGQITSSVLTGMTIPIFTNPLNVIKMNNWNHIVSKTEKCPKLLDLAIEIKKKYGYGEFYKGMIYTVSRDVLFSSAFYYLSNNYNKKKSFLNDALFGSVATIIVSPVNYFRNRLYFDFDKKITLKYMVKETMAETKQKQTVAKQISFLLFSKFNIGYGSLRVGLGMAMSKKLYDLLNYY